MLTSDIDPALLDSVNGKTVIITGGSNGIGAETVRLFHHHGANIVVADLPSSRDTASKLLSPLVEGKCNGIFVETDIQNWESMKRLYQTAIERFGSVEVVVANAGTMEKVPFFDMDHLDEEPTSAYKVIDVNVKGTMNSKLSLADTRCLLRKLRSDYY
jgi:NAD(P)-dependent dehydrogenase (short-subunit alcohol dehydrogenase family)